MYPAGLDICRKRIYLEIVYGGFADALSMKQPSGSATEVFGSMKKILFINACVRPCSRTYTLADKVLKHLEGEPEEVRLCDAGLLPLDWERLQKRDGFIASGDFDAPMLRYAMQFADADEIVIAAPYWDLAFPSLLRVYFEHITVAGLTFSYSADGIPKGACKAKKLIYVTTAGGPISEHNFGYEYVKALSVVFYGIPEIICFQAENLDVEGADTDHILELAANEIDEYFKNRK